MVDTEVKITHIADQVGFDPATTLPTRVKVVTYMVGTHGPFNLVTPAGKFSQEYVEAETKKTADTIRALGGLALK